jgi:hypothetical protein
VFGVAPPLAVAAAATYGVYALLQAPLALWPKPSTDNVTRPDSMPR